MDKILIHIGYNKTASSWLQQRLFTSDSKVFEPLSRTASGQSTLAELFYLDGTYMLSPFDDNKKKIENEIDSILSSRQANEKVFVLSHERLSGNPNSGGFDAKKIALMLKAIFPDGKVLILIREQKSFLLSYYFQYLAIGGTFSIKKYLTRQYDGKIPFFSPHHINYYPLINEYCQLFGKDNVLIIPYELFCQEPKLFLKKLGRFLDIHLDVELSSFSERVNQKENLFMMYHLRCLNGFKKSSSVNNYSFLKNKYAKRIVNKLIRAGYFLPNTWDENIKKFLYSQIAKFVGSRYVDSNKMVAQLIDIDLSQYGYY